MEEELRTAKEILEKHNQNHLVKVLNKLQEARQKEMINQILSIDFEELDELYELTGKPIDIEVSELEPITAINPDRLSRKELKEYIEIGRQIVRDRKLAVVTMAGGQRNKTTEMTSQKVL